MKATNPKLKTLIFSLAIILFASGVQAQQVIHNDLTVQNPNSATTVLRISGTNPNGGSANFSKLYINNFILSVSNVPSPSFVGGLHLGHESLTSYGLFINNNGNVGIGSKQGTSSTYKLSVNGSIRANEIVCETGWSDFVFAPNYKLMPLKDVEIYITKNQHLPEIPSAEEVKENGVRIAEMESKLLQKVEELTLYLIQQNKDLEILKLEIEKLKLENAQLKNIGTSTITE